MKPRKVLILGICDPFPCFSCGEPMEMTGAYGWCDACQVSEAHHDHVSRVRSFSSGKWYGELVSYIDHSREHHPSPA